MFKQQHTLPPESPSTEEHHARERDSQTIDEAVIPGWEVPPNDSSDSASGSERSKPVGKAHTLTQPSPASAPSSGFTEVEEGDNQMKKRKLPADTSDSQRLRQLLKPPGNEESTYDISTIILSKKHDDKAGGKVGRSVSECAVRTAEERTTEVPHIPQDQGASAEPLKLIPDPLTEPWTTTTKPLRGARGEPGVGKVGKNPPRSQLDPVGDVYTCAVCGEEPYGMMVSVIDLISGK